MQDSSFCAISAVMAAQAYTAQGRDYSFAYPEDMEQISADGELWGYISGGDIAAIGGLVPAASHCALARAAAKTGICGTMLILPIVAADRRCVQPLLHYCLRRAGGAPLALLPIKSGSRQTSTYFSEGLSVIAMRPLHELRAYYILAPGIYTSGDALSIPIAASCRISRLLEHGYAGIAICKNEMTVQRRKMPNEAGNIG